MEFRAQAELLCRVSDLIRCFSGQSAAERLSYIESCVGTPIRGGGWTGNKFHLRSPEDLRRAGWNLSLSHLNSFAKIPLAGIPVSFVINGSEHELTIPPWMTLLDLLRERLQLAGTKKGCDHHWLAAAGANEARQSRVSEVPSVPIG